MKLICTALGVFLLLGCKPKPKVFTKADVENKIMEFYKVAEAKDYDPIYFSDMDTLENLQIDGEVFRITGKVRHGFNARSNLKGVQVYTEEFTITIFKDVLIAVPDLMQ